MPLAGVLGQGDDNDKMSLVAGLINQEIEYVYSIARSRSADKTRTEVYKNVPCRWQQKNNIILTRDGEELMSTVDVWVLPIYDIKKNYELIFGGKTYVVIAVQKRYDIGGSHNYTRIWAA